VQLHYCCGRVAGVSIGYQENKGCDHIGMSEMSGCCQNDMLTMDVDDDQGLVTTATLPEIVSHPHLLYEGSIAFTQTAVSADNKATPIRGGPPLGTIIPTYLLIQVFRN
jgi:hypothetical protein